jgi:hypothetical protein
VRFIKPPSPARVRCVNATEPVRYLDDLTNTVEHTAGDNLART